MIDEASAARMVIEFRLEKADASVVRRSWMLIHSLLTPWTRPFPTRPFRQLLLANSQKIGFFVFHHGCVDVSRELEFFDKKSITMGEGLSFDGLDRGFAGDRCGRTSARY